MIRPTLSLAAAAAMATTLAVAAPATAQSKASGPDVAAKRDVVQVAQGWGPPPRRRYGRRYDRRYGPPPGYGYRPYGVVSPGTVRLRLLARGYHAIRGIRYIPHRPGRRYGRGPGARFPGHYVAYGRRFFFTYRFLLNPYTGRPYARIRAR